MHTETTAPAATWTTERRGFPQTNSQARVYVSGPITVTQAGNLERGAKGWAFQYEGLGATETHTGFPTLAKAKAAAEAYTTAPIRQAHTLLDTFRR